MKWFFESHGDFVRVLDYYGGDLYLRQVAERALIEAIEAWLLADWQ